MTIGSITHTTTATSSVVSTVADTFHLSASSIAGTANGRQVDQLQQGSYGWKCSMFNQHLLK